MSTLLRMPAILILVFSLCACATQPYDYSNFLAHRPRSILVLPPTNQSADVKATYGYLSTVTWPLAEKGYYVYPVAIVDNYMKENGLPNANEMQNVPLAKIQEVFAADAVLYINVTEYGTKYQIINSATEVSAEGKLVDVRTGITIWDGRATVVQDSNQGAGGGNPIASLIAAAVTALVEQIINTSTDHAHEVSRFTNAQMFMDKNRGLLNGPYVPETR